MKQQQIKMDYVKSGELEKEIAINENFVIRAYQVYAEEDLNNKRKGEKMKDIIKVILSDSNGLDELKNGITYEEVKYIPLITSPSMQKKEEKQEESFKLEYFFIREDKKEFVHILERLLSGNKIKQFETDKKNMCLVKDIVARCGLATTETYKINYNPKFIVIPEAVYKSTDKYTILEENEFKTGEYEREFTLNDGGGLMSNNMAQIIKENMELDYQVDFAVIRNYKGLAVKGLVLRFDYANYMKKLHKEIGDTDYFRWNKEKLVYEIKDIFNIWYNVDSIDMILNETMVKWLGNWDKAGGLKDLEDEYSNEFYYKYKDILDCLYISKVNKDTNKLKSHTQVNYQVLQNTCLSANDLVRLAQPTISYYKRLLHFKDIRAIRLFLGDMANELHEGDYENNISTKLNFILANIGEEALKMRWVKRQVARLITRQIKLLAGGKMWIEGGYKYGALDPVTYCNWIITRDRGSNGLKVGEYYISGEVGKRVMYRNPIALYQEIQKIELSNKLDKWLSSYTPELVFFNGFDNRLFLMSTADLDGDGFGVVNSELLYSCIVDEEYPFINKEDGKKVAHDFTREQLYKDIITSSGNIIGSIAISNAKINAICTSLENVVFNDKAYTFQQLKDLYCTTKDIDLENIEDKEEKKVKSKEINEIIKKTIKEKCKTFKEFKSREQRYYIKQVFYNHKEKYFKILLASQLAIDMPKSLTPIPRDLKEEINKYSILKKPIFMHYLGKCSCKGNGSLKECKDILRWGKDGDVKKASNMMDAYCQYIVSELLKEDFKQMNGSENCNKLLKLMNYECENGKYNDELANLCNSYREEHEKLRKKKVERKELDKLDLETMLNIENMYLNDEDIVVTLKEIKPTVRFIMLFFWNTVKNKISTQKLVEATSHIKDDNGDINWMFSNYKEVSVKSNITDIYTEDKLNLIKKAEKIKIRIDGYEGLVITDKLIVNDNYLYREDGICLGHIIKEFQKLVINGQVLEVIESKIDKSGMRASIWIE